MYEIRKNQQIIEEELRKVGRKGTEALISAMEEFGFFKAHCSGHDRYVGGTANHVLWVLFVAMLELEKYPEKYAGISVDSLRLVCLLHDLGNMHSGFRNFDGHGRRSANILRELGVDLSEEEMSAIRFHMGHRCHIVDRFDRNLATYRDSALAKLLRFSDHTAASVMNNIGYAGNLTPAIKDFNGYRNTVIYNPVAKHWYMSTMRCPLSSFPSRNGDVKTDTLSSKPASTIFGLNMYHVSSYDLTVLKNEEGNLGLFTVVTSTMGEGDFYRSDRGGFNYKKVVVYNNNVRGFESVHYVVTENLKGEWSIVRIHKNKYRRGEYFEFIGRSCAVTGCKSEADALYQFRHSCHGVDLSNALLFERIEVTSEMKFNNP